jgi:hypothetical protein
MSSKLMIASLAIAMAAIVLFASGSTVLRDKVTLGPFAKFGESALLSDPSSINGTVTDAATTLPINNANVTAGGVFDLTDSNGRYNFDIAPGNYTVSVTRLGYTDQSKNATVLANMTTTVNFALSPNLVEMGWIAGNVTNANTSMPIEGASVEVNGYSTQTNATGSYKIQVPAPETYNVTASKVGYLDNTVSNVSVKPGNTTSINIALTPVLPPFGTLEGNVTDASTHMPIENAMIMAGNKTAETNSTGRYKIELAPGTYNVTASKKGYVSQTKTGIVITAGNVTTLDFALVKVQIKATVVIHPRSLNLRSEGRWITASIEFEAGFDARDVNVSSIKLNNTIPVDLTAPMEFNGSMLTVKFDREVVENFILNELREPSKFGMVTLTLTGKLKDGTTFTGDDMIKTIFNMNAKEI